MSYEREITDEHIARREQIEDFQGIESPKSWLAEQAKKYKLVSADALCYLLAHADDGVIWGRIEPNGTLITSYDALQNSPDEDQKARLQSVLPPLRAETLQQARLFSEHGELAIWRDGEEKWHGRIIANAAEGDEIEWKESFDEPYLLWGDHVAAVLADGFTLVADGQQGMYHAVPFLAGDMNEAIQLRLMTRHYLNRAGFTHVVASRLVSF